MLRSTVPLRNKINLDVMRAKFVLPERFKGTVIEKWANYWKSLYLDYKSMVVDIRTEMQEKPKKAIFVLSALGAAVQMAKNNPNEIDFNDSLRSYNNQLCLVGEPCQNPRAVNHFKMLEDYNNRGMLRRFNLGVMSLLWVDDYSENCGIYKSQCSYIKPGYTSIPFRIVDVGMFGRWWNMYIKFQDFDINI